MYRAVVVNKWDFGCFKNRENVGAIVAVVDDATKDFLRSLTGDSDIGNVIVDIHSSKSAHEIFIFNVTDTIGAMATAICGALHGVNAIDPACKRELDAVNQLDFNRYATALAKYRQQREAV